MVRQGGSASRFSALPWQRRSAMAETFFLKVERVRRLHNARLTEVDVQRGEDGSFGIGLSDENEITNFHHETNAPLLQVGDQIRKVDEIHLVRERLSVVVQRDFAEAPQAQWHRPGPPPCTLRPAVAMPCRCGCSCPGRTGR